MHVALKSNRDGVKMIFRSTQVQILTDMVHQWHMRVGVDASSLNVTGKVLKNKAIFFRDKILNDFAECLKSSDIIHL